MGVKTGISTMNDDGWREQGGGYTFGYREGADFYLSVLPSREGYEVRVAGVKIRGDVERLEDAKAIARRLARSLLTEALAALDELDAKAGR